MDSTREKKQQNRMLFCRSDDFEQVVIIIEAVSNESQNVVVNNGLADGEDIANNNDNLALANENAVNFQTVEWNLTDRITKKE